jgi:hypothetical protein
MYEPSGPDVARELEAFISAVRGGSVGTQSSTTLCRQEPNR